MAAVKTRRRVEVLLKRSMLAAGMGLGLALAARYGLEKAGSGPGQQRMPDLARRYAAEMLADWLKAETPEQWARLMLLRRVRRAGPGSDNFSLITVFVEE